MQLGSTALGPVRQMIDGGRPGAEVAQTDRARRRLHKISCRVASAVGAMAMSSESSFGRAAPAMLSRAKRARERRFGRRSRAASIKKGRYRNGGCHARRRRTHDAQRPLPCTGILDQGKPGGRVKARIWKGSERGSSLPRPPKIAQQRARMRALRKEEGSEHPRTRAQR